MDKWEVTTCPLDEASAFGSDGWEPVSLYQPLQVHEPGNWRVLLKRAALAPASAAATTKKAKG